MRTVSYKILSSINADSYNLQGTLVDLVLDIPYLLSFKVIPTFRVLNRILKSGEIDFGLGGYCQWQPLSIGMTEYEDLIEHLLTQHSYLIVDDDLEGDTYEEWLHSVLKYYEGQIADFLAAYAHSESTQRSHSSP